MKPESSLLCSQEPATGHHLEPDESNPHFSKTLGPCHHDMARSRVSDGGDCLQLPREDSCEYTEKAVMDIRQGVVLQFGCLSRS
jgi:hypothetical protein